jgi:hypothetical protein
MYEGTTHPGINIQLILPLQSSQFSNFGRKLQHTCTVGGGEGGGCRVNMKRRNEGNYIKILRADGRRIRCLVVITAM